MRQFIIFVGITILFTVSCNNSNHEADAYGNFMADEIIVSSEVSGRVLQVYAKEGDKIEAGGKAVFLDTAQSHLKVTELQAKEKAAFARLNNLNSQIAVYEQQKSVLQKDFERIGKMLSEGAATQKQYDDVSGKIKVIDKQIAVIFSNKSTVLAEIQAIKAGVLLANNMLSKTKIVFPVDGTVLEKYISVGEVALPGKALFKIANLEEMEITAYVSGKQLTAIKLGQTVTVSIDKAEGGLKDMNGKITWIASQAEFTPKNIQTREERLSQVYAIKVSVKNDGSIRINMPGEVRF
jgi:HlyD family secretion protein